MQYAFLFLILFQLVDARECFCTELLHEVPALEDSGTVAGFVQRRDGITRHVLVVFCRFRDVETGWAGVPAWSEDIFSPGRPGSFSHFYDSMSRGKLRVRGEIAPKIYESVSPASAYLARDPAENGDFGQFSLEILEQADVDVDFSNFDNDGPDGVPNSGDDDGDVDGVFLVLSSVPGNFFLGNATGVSGLGFSQYFTANDLSAGRDPIRISPVNGTIQQGRNFTEAVGSMCHEFGHVLGLADLYNVGFLHMKEALPEKDSAGIGAWGLMGWGAAGWNGNDGPNSFCAFSRVQLGWSDVLVADRPSQEVRLQSVGTGGTVLKVPLTPNEYFLVAYRRRADSFYDRHIPGEGVLIWHVAPQFVLEGIGAGVDLECADGLWRDAGYPRGEEADVVYGGDNLDFWAHDEVYRTEHYGNLGDATDLFDGVRFRTFTPDTNPSACSLNGQVCAWIEDIRLEEGHASVRVRLDRPVIRLLNLSVEDEDGDGAVRVGEEGAVAFTLIHEGGYRPRDVEVRLRSDDPLVDVVTPMTRFSELELGVETGSAEAEGPLPSLRFGDGFAGTHSASVFLEVSVDEIQVARQELMVWGVSPRQVVERVGVLEKEGNGDNMAQVGEAIQLQLRLQDMDRAELLKEFTFTLTSLHEDVVQVGRRVYFDWESNPLQSIQSPEFVVPSSVQPGSRLDFEFAVSHPSLAWKDTLSILVQAGGDLTPPRGHNLYIRSTLHGPRFILPSRGIIDGSPIRSVEALVYSAEDTSLLDTVPLSWTGDGYEGVWADATPDSYLVQAVVEDQAGNRGQWQLQPFSFYPAESGDIPLPDSFWPSESGGVSRPGSWELLELPGRLSNFAEQLFMAPSDPDVLYAVSSAGAWRSQDGGANWVRLSLLPGPTVGYSFPPVIWVDARDPFIIYSSHQFDSVPGFKSQDGGMSWKSLDAPVELKAMDPVQSGRLYGVWDGSLVISQDGGESWIRTDVAWEADVTWEAIGPMGVFPTRSQVLYAGWVAGRDPENRQIIPGVLFRSGDGGEAWERFDQTRRLDEGIIPDPLNEDGLYATRRDTLLYSADQGRSWQVRSIWDSDFMAYSSFAIHPSEPHLLFAWSFFEFWRSWNGGVSWQKSILPGFLPQFTGRIVHSLLLHPSDPQRFFICNPSAGWDERSLMETWDGGTSWTDISLPETPPPAGTLLFDPDGKLYVGSVDLDSDRDIISKLYISNDGGETWEGRGQGAGGEFRSAPVPSIQALYVDSTDPQIFLAHQDDRFIRSIDGGETWDEIEEIVRAEGSYPIIVAHPQRKGLYLLRTSSQRVYRSADFGASWEEGLEGVPARGFSALAVDPLNGAGYGAYRDSIWVSMDGGLSWEFSSRMGKGYSTNVLEIPSHDPEKMYAVTDGGLFVSPDRGQTWSQLLEPGVWGMGLSGRSRLRFDPSDPNRLFLVTGWQVMETRNAGKTWFPWRNESGIVPFWNDVAVDPLDPDVVLAATNWGVLRLKSGEESTAVGGRSRNEPTLFSLARNYPNPFNSSTMIPFQLSQETRVKLMIYNTAGQRVKTLINGTRPVGQHRTIWDGKDDAGRSVGSGVYFYRLSADTQTQTKRMAVVR
jgi:M6 family metalloprotease-like protein